MATTRTPGITVDTEGFRTINKEHRGERIFARLGLVGQEHAERRLAQELERLGWELERRAHARPLFSDFAKRFLVESKYKRSRADIAWHLGMLSRYVGDLEVRKVHDDVATAHRSTLGRWGERDNDQSNAGSRAYHPAPRRARLS